MTRTQTDARYIAEQGLQAQAAGDATAAKHLFGQAEAIDPIPARLPKLQRRRAGTRPVAAVGKY